jgi:geranylgeranyl reductase family protein
MRSVPTSADVVVAGAGPAGSAAAHLLASAGADVMLIERARFPRDKSCGDGVTAHSVAILNDMGLSFESFDGKAVRVRGGRVGAPTGETFAAAPDAADPAGAECWVVPRVVLDERLARAAQKAGARLVEGTSVTRTLHDTKGRVVGVECTDGASVRAITARVVIGADGAHSAVAASLGLDRAPERHIGYALRGYYTGVADLGADLEIYYFDGRILPGYGWVFPVADATANIGIGIYAGELRRSSRKLRDILAEFVAREPNVAPRLAQAKPVGRAVGWPLPVSTLHRPTVFDGALLCGDAASLVDPLTGEGIWTALVSGRSAGRAALAAVAAKDASREVLAVHEREWRRIAGGYLSAGRLLKNLAKSARLLSLVVRRARENAYYASRALGYGLGTLDRRRALRAIVLRALFNPSFFRPS